MRALIIGCGYVGVPLGKRLIQLGHEVHGMRRTAESAAELGQFGIKPVVGDISPPGALDALDGFDWIVNCVSSDKGGAAEYRQVYLEGNQKLVAWARTHPAKKI